MMMDRLKVNLRKYKHLFYIKKTVIDPNELLQAEQYEDGFTIINYPIIKDMNSFNKIIVKLKWYIPFIPKINMKIAINIDKNINQDVTDLIDKIQDDYYSIEILHNLSSKKLVNYDIILLFKLSKFNLMRFKFSSWLKKSINVDPNFYHAKEGNNFRGLLYHLLNKEQKQELLDNSIENYKKLLKSHGKSKKINLFLTGPSLDNLYDFDFTGSVNIICNSIVKNEQYLEHIKPDILVFADPVYHYSYNEYAKQFREDVKATIFKYGIYCVVSEKSLPLLYYHYPELRNNLIGVPIISKPSFNAITNDHFYSIGGESILPIFMFPLGAALGKEIFLIGADGRQKTEKFFWKHSNKAQYNDLMKDIMINHPSFFDDRIYEDFYQEYCNNLEKVITTIEEDGIKIFTLTKSYIPTLESRYYRSDGILEDEQLGS